MKKFELKCSDSEFKSVKITNGDDSFNVIRNFYSDDIEIFESCFILLLNQANFTIGYAKISQGGITGTVVDIRIIAKYAIDSLATGVIFAHNHPSGNLKASEQDLLMTKKIKEGLKTLDINLMDSLIITSNGYTSIL